MPRLRQICLAAPELEPAIQELRAALGLREGFLDPGVGVFGLENEVAVLGDTFVEVVAPLRPDAAAHRWLERRGGAPGGYMLLFEVRDVAATRARIRAAGVRIVFEAPAPGILGFHCHPKDLGGCIVSLDVTETPGEWPWAGPDWKERAAPGRLRAVTVAVNDPDAMLDRWQAVLDCPVRGKTLLLDEGGAVELVQSDRFEGVVAAEIDSASRGPLRKLACQGVNWAY